jgi:hypothetical protein
MEYTPFTLEEAKEIAEDFEDLKDTEFNIDTPYEFMVHDVVVCPFNQADKKTFVDGYYRSKDQSESIRFFKGNDYDVILFAFDVDDEANYTYINIRDFVLEKGIKYNFPIN